jgi:hypothetical protein
MPSFELMIWIVAALLLASVLSTGLWRLLAQLLPMLNIPYWRLATLQTFISALTCWALALGPEIGWFGLLLFLSVLQTLLSALVLPLWLFARRIASCDPLRERI